MVVVVTVVVKHCGSRALRRPTDRPEFNYRPNGSSVRQDDDVDDDDDGTRRALPPCLPRRRSADRRAGSQN